MKTPFRKYTLSLWWKTCPATIKSQNCATRYTQSNAIYQLLSSYTILIKFKRVKISGSCIDTSNVACLSEITGDAPQEVPQFFQVVFKEVAKALTPRTSVWSVTKHFQGPFPLIKHSVENSKRSIKCIYGDTRDVKVLHNSRGAKVLQRYLKGVNLLPRSV